MNDADEAATEPGLRLDIAPRFYETDALGHINNNALGGWFEAARSRYLRELTGYRRAVDAPWVVAAVSMEFVRETAFEHPVSLSVRPARVGRSSVTVAGTARQNGEVTMRAMAVMVHMDRAAGKPEPIPEHARQALERDAAPDAPTPRAPGRG